MSIYGTESAEGSDVKRWAATVVSPTQSKAENLFIRGIIGFLSDGDGLTDHSYPRSLDTDCFAGGVGGRDGSKGGSPIEQKRVEKSYSAEKGKNGLGECKGYNPFRGLVHTLLSDKVVYLTLSGFLLLPLGTFGLFWLFEDSNRNRKLLGGLIAAVILPLAFGLVGFGLFG